MSVIIKNINDTCYSYQDVVQLLHASFDERLKQGLHFTCSYMSSETFQNRVKDGTVLVAFDQCTGELLGTATVHIRKNNRGNIYGYNEYLAILPKAKRTGLGTQLLNSRIQLVLNAGGRYIESDTAVGAKSSLKWHLKNGFQIVGVESFKSTNYYSYLFRKQLCHPSVWDCRLIAKISYAISYVKTHLLKKQNGEYTLLGTAVARLLKR